MQVVEQEMFYAVCWDTVSIAIAVADESKKEHTFHGYRTRIGLHPEESFSKLL